MTKIKPIKPYKSLEEEANFWDTHDVSKMFKDSKTSMSDLLELEPKKDVAINKRLYRII